MAKYTVSNYPRDNLSPKTRSMLDALASNPATSNIGVNSGYRSPATNAKARGAKKSQHMHGNAVDLDLSGLSPAGKKAALDAAIAAGAKGVGVYQSGTSLHIDPRATPTVWGPLKNAYKGLTKSQFGMLPDWARPSIEAMFGGVNTKQRPSVLPDTMQAPAATRQQALADISMQAAVAQAYRDPMRALDVVPSAQMPSRPSTPTPPSRLSAAPLGQVTRGPSLPDPTKTAAMPRSIDRPGMTAPSWTQASAARMAAPAATAPTQSFQPIDRSVTPANPGNLGGIAMSNPQGNFSVGPSMANLAEQYGQYRTPTTYQNVRTAMQAIPAPAPPSVVAPPAPVLAPAPAIAPALAAPGGFPPAPRAPSFTPSDIYGGQVGTAMSSSGNMVGRDNFGFTSVTNKHGATTVTTPGGMQAAQFGGIKGPLGGVNQGIKPEAPSAPGVLGKSGAEWGQMAKTGVAGVAGSAIGSLGGPIGSLIGSAVARELSKPGGGLVGGLINGTKTINTSKIPGFAPMTVFAKPQGGLSFPSAPGGGYTGSASFSNRSEGGMRDISPAAARDISKGKAGLY